MPPDRDLRKTEMQTLTRFVLPNKALVAIT
jgi:hypothetical protein